MEEYILKFALVAEIKRLRDRAYELYGCSQFDTAYNNVLKSIDTLEVKEVGIDIPNIDDLFEEDGIDPASKEAKVFKECYYMALERLKEKKGERTGQ